jgi:hypothetical protein
MAEVLPHDVERIFSVASEDVQKYLKKLRFMIFSVAQADPDIGPIEETVKWGQVSYIPSQTRSGTTIRIADYGSGKVAMFFHCQTTMIPDVKQLFGDTFCYEKNRALILPAEEAWPESELKVCIHMALTYHNRK